MTLSSGYKGFPVSSGTGSSIRASAPQSTVTHTCINTDFYPSRTPPTTLTSRLWIKRPSDCCWDSLEFLLVVIVYEYVGVGFMFWTSVDAVSQLCKTGAV